MPLFRGRLKFSLSEGPDIISHRLHITSTESAFCMFYIQVGLGMKLFVFCQQLYRELITMRLAQDHQNVQWILISMLFI